MDSTGIWGLSVWSLGVSLMSVWVSTVQRHAALGTELLVCVNVNGCLSLFVSVQWVQVYPASRPVWAGMGSCSMISGLKSVTVVQYGLFCCMYYVYVYTQYMIHNPVEPVLCASLLYALLYYFKLHMFYIFHNLYYASTTQWFRWLFLFQFSYFCSEGPNLLFSGSCYILIV